MNALNESRHDWDYWQNASFAILWDLTICPNLEVPYDCNERNRSVSLSVSNWFNKFYNTHSLGGNYFPWKYLSLSFVPIRNCLYALVCLAVCIGILCPTFLEFKQGKYTWGRATLDSYFKLFTHNVFSIKVFHQAFLVHSICISELVLLKTIFLPIVILQSWVCWQL